MERGEIEAFLTLAEELHFGRTAERLGLSPGRMSQIIQGLERRAGIALFERTSRRVELTGAGRDLRDEVARGHRIIEDAWARTVAAGRGISGSLRLGYLGAGAAEALVRVMKEFQRRHPECELELADEAEIHDHLAPLRSGHLDLLATRFPVREPDLTQGPVLFRTPLFLAVPAGHRLADRSEVELEDLGDVPVLAGTTAGDLWDERVPPQTPSGRPIRKLRMARTFQILVTLVGAGQGVSPVVQGAQRFYPRPDVVYRPLRVPPEDWGLVWRTGEENARVRAFVEVARAVVAQSGGPKSMAAWVAGDASSRH
ncbi:LysR family transcriptional regulator [Streptomyces sp. NPDC002577]